MSLKFEPMLLEKNNLEPEPSSSPLAAWYPHRKHRQTSKKSFLVSFRARSSSPRPPGSAVARPIDRAPKDRIFLLNGSYSRSEPAAVRYENAPEPIINFFCRDEGFHDVLS